MKMTEPMRVLALDITGKGLAYACLEGSENLYLWGTLSVKDKSKNSYLERAEELYEWHLPHLLILEDIKGPKAKKRLRAKTVIHRLELFALGKSLPVFKVSRADVSRAFRAKNKHEVAQAIAALFPVLKDALPSPRRPWENEAERMNVFDAISFALTAYDYPEKLEEIEA
jgi:hypothetical protein